MRIRLMIDPGSHAWILLIRHFLFGLRGAVRKIRNPALSPQVAVAALAVSHGVIGRVLVHVRQAGVVETGVHEGGGRGSHRCANKTARDHSQEFSPIMCTPTGCSLGKENTSFSRPQRSPISAPPGLCWYRQRPTTWGRPFARMP